jgi:coenzyme F420-reducing hydrogenase delta subunit
MVRRPFTPKQFLSIVGVQEETMDGAESSINFKRKILKIIKDLTNNGKHLEANQLYQKYFGGKNGKN